MIVVNREDLRLLTETGAQLLLISVGNFLAGQGIKSYLVGGFVRDALLRRDTADIDIALLADALVIATPIYYFTVSAQTKLFMDRWYSLGEEKDTIINGKKMGIVLTYGDTDPFTSGAINAIRTFQDAFDYLGANLVDIGYGSASEAGEIKENQELMDKAYKLGQELASAK